MKKAKRKIFNIAILVTSLTTLILLLLAIFLKGDDKINQLNIEAFNKFYSYQNLLEKSNILNKKFVNQNTLEGKIDAIIADSSDYYKSYKDGLETWGIHTTLKDDSSFLDLTDLKIDSSFFESVKKMADKKMSYDEIVELFSNNSAKNIQFFNDKHLNSFLYTTVKSSYSRLDLWIGALICFIFTLVLIPLRFIFSDNEISKATEAIEKILQTSDVDSKQIKPAWDSAQQTLELYYQRNLSQINLIFYLSVIVMCMGFVLIIAGVIIAFAIGEKKEFIGILSAASGLITEFIGATFIFLYKSTIAQSLEYTKKLDKLTSVGVSIKILDTISSEKEYDPKTLIDAKIEIAKKLLEIDKTQSQPLT